MQLTCVVSGSLSSRGVLLERFLATLRRNLLNALVFLGTVTLLKPIDKNLFISGLKFGSQTI